VPNNSRVYAFGKTLGRKIILLCAKQVGIPGVNSAVLKVNEGF
jgi:hypothetical protein